MKAIELVKSIIFALCQECDYLEDCNNKKHRICKNKAEGIAKRLKREFKIERKKKPLQQGTKYILTGQVHTNC